MFKNDPLLFRASTKYNYTTHGFAVLGCAVEGASGMSFPDYIRENVFKPAEMDRIRVDNVADIIPSRAQAIRRPRAESYATPAWPIPATRFPAGDSSRPSKDLARFAIANAERHACEEGDARSDVDSAEELATARVPVTDLDGASVSETDEGSSSRRRSAASEHFSVHDS